ncbi:histidinol-phosphatase HisJ [Liquorilactobacillus mali]|uniref:Histidinol-phosphatase n=1 Tax=Liquorilactobacillus mali TaxID=1618 RepID=A0A0R2FIX2_9LACO|nr:histidinol-phosphatase HisJ [Liquorilactobacillus mali]KRN28552.1 histidinol-phosphatase [Liquorilactobacillus mali]MDN7146199.1 histidinol-phosphatase HisJ [Liquorilactobacillus mali]
MKKDGHTHTELCPHGSGDSTAEMIEKAIELGFSEYCITEHAPLPKRFASEFRGSIEGLETASLEWSQLDDYFKLCANLQKKYGDVINIKVGFEVDYLPGFEKEIKQFLDEYGAQTQENILSVHFMKGTDNGFWCVDYDTVEFADGFSNFLADPRNLYHRYLELIQQAVSANLGKYAPQRIGHMNLIKKYQDYFELPAKFDANNLELITGILNNIKRQKRELDFNTAGLYKPYCNEVYPGSQIIQMACEKKIPLVFGSDAHSIAEVGHGYHLTDFIETLDRK